MNAAPSGVPAPRSASVCSPDPLTRRAVLQSPPVATRRVPRVSVPVPTEPASRIDIMAFEMVRKKIKWATRKRKGSSRKWKSKYVLVKKEITK